MKLCVVCGNDIPDAASVCPFCESPQPGGAPARGRSGPVVTVNLEKGLPLVDEALARLEMRLAEARVRGTRVLRVVHGYGSSGTGGRIGDAVGRQLREMQRRGLVRTVVRGEDYPDGSAAARRLLERHPELRRSLRTDRGNRGMTLVEL